jgi:hypothetical protein
MSPATLDFVAADHRYYVEGTELPSVTAILKNAGLVDDAWFEPVHRERGSYVHLGCRLIDDDELDEASIDPAILPYLDAYRSFLAVTQPAWTYLEHRVWDPVMRYAGTLDRAGLVQGEKVVLDIKSGGCPPSVGPQTAAYRRCLPQPYSWKRAALQLKADGTFRLHPLTDRGDEHIFLAALALSQWKVRQLS